MDSNTTRLVCVGGLIVLSFLLLVTLIQHPVLTVGLILLVLWLFLHPKEADNLWQSFVPAFNEILEKVAKDIGNNGNGGKSEIQNSGGEKFEIQSGIQIENGGKTANQTESDSKTGIQKENGGNSEIQTCAPRMQDQKSIIPSPILELDRLLALANDDDDGDIEIDPLDSKLDHPDLLQPISTHMDPKFQGSPAKIVGPSNLASGPQKSAFHPVPQKSLQNPNPAPAYSGPDLVILNAPGTNQRRVYGGAGDDEFYVTSVDYEQFEFEPLIITEQVPRTTEWFEKLSERKRAEFMKEQIMHERLARSQSRVPADI